MAKRSTKQQLLLSAISLLLCVSMLVGSTFAWFTDSVTSTNNIIKSGTLDVKLEYSLDMENWDEVDKDTNIFKKDALWEPGYTEVVYLRVSNVGTLDLKYNLGINVASEIQGKNVDGELFNLSDHINFTAIEGVEDEYADRDAARKAAGTGKAIKSGYTKSGKLYDKEEPAKENSVTLALVVFMPETVGNEANYRTDETFKNKPQINLGINLFATQLANEKDSFDETYDEKAPALIWDGTADTSWYVAGAKEYTLSTPEQLAGLAKLVNAGNNFAGIDLYMAADMDLDNKAWTPIGTADANFNGNFYGTGYTIYNLNVSGEKRVGLFGSASNAAHFEGITVDGANVSGINSVGTVLGYGYLAANCLKNCTVMNATVVANGNDKENGDKVGAVAGWTANGNIFGNKAIDCTVYGCRDMGGIVGYVAGENRGATVSNNTVDNVTLAIVPVADYEAGKHGTNINDTVGRIGGTYTITVTGNNGKCDVFGDEESDPIVVNNTESLKEALDNNTEGAKVNVAPGTYTFPASSLGLGDTLECAPGTVFTGSSSLNVNGATVVGAEFSNKSGNAVGGTVNGTFKDCTFDGSNGLRGCYAGETVVFENCTFSGDVYGVHFDGGANDVIFKNCTFSGFNAFGSAITKLTLDGCTFVANGRSGYNGINMWGDTDVIDCTFIFDGSVDYEWVDLSSSNQTVTFTNCVVTDGTTEKGVETVVGNFATGNTITVDGIPVVFFNDDLKTAVANGATKVMLREGDYDLNGNQKDGLTLVGLGDGVNVANTTKYASGNSTGAIWKAINLENVTLTNTVYTMADGGNATFKDVNFAAGFRQGYGKNVVFDGCTFGSNSEGYALHFQSDSASEGGNITINECEFLGGKVHLGGKRAYTFTACDFAAGTDFQVWSNITLDGCTVGEETVTAANLNTLFPNLDAAKVTIK